MNRSEYLEYHEDPALDDRIADAMDHCLGCGNVRLCNEDGLCRKCAEDAKECAACGLERPVGEDGLCLDCYTVVKELERGIIR